MLCRGPRIPSSCCKSREHSDRLKSVARIFTLFLRASLSLCFMFFGNICKDVKNVSFLFFDAIQTEMESSSFKTSCEDEVDSEFTTKFEYKFGSTPLSWNAFAMFAKVDFDSDYCKKLSKFFVSIPGTEVWLPACFMGNIRSLCCVSCQKYQQKKYPDYCDAPVVLTRLSSPAKKGDYKLKVSTISTFQL